MPVRRTILGVAGGLICAAMILPLADRPRTGAPTDGGPILSECDGAVRELVIHYVAEAGPLIAPIYREFLRQLPEGVAVHVVCPRRADYDELIQEIGPTRCALWSVIVSHEMTFWSRDRWVAMGPSACRPTTTLWCPHGEDGAEIWPARAGDERIGEDLAAALPSRLAAQRSELCFDGGDLLADGRTVFVAPAMLRRNLQRTVRSPEELRRFLEAKLQRRVVLLDGAPDHHVGMYMMAAGDGVVVVGDPAAAHRLLDARAATRPASSGGGAELCPDEGPDFSGPTQARFDTVARQCAEAGYRVVRIPTVPGKNGRAFITYVNGLIDQRDGRRTIFMPTYRGLEELNAAAGAVWESLGYRVCPVDCTDIYVHFGTLHCLVNVLSRSGQ